MNQNISQSMSFSLLGSGFALAAGISHEINGFCWLTVGNAILGWMYVASKIWQTFCIGHL